ncbi:MAG: GAF domain-containing protein [Chloroflexi bacterium]|nr:GAF domain-containing protein [Chloroflexota bacterium]
MQAPLPANENERLQTLRRYKILDSDPEQAFDDITQLAAQLCETPMAVISFVDEHRQWFKSRVCVGFSETSRDIAFCAHALLEPDILIVPDTLEDPRFVDNPMVTGEPYQRFYAGALLRGYDNHAIGTLCVMDIKPRQLSEAQINGLKALARQVVAQLDLRLGQAVLSDEVARQESVLNNLINTLPGLVYQCKNEPDWPMVFIGGRVKEISGYTATDFLTGRVVWGNLIHPDEQEMVWVVVQEALANNKSFQINYRITDKEGLEKQVWEQGVGLYDATGQLLTLEGFITDVTEQTETALTLARQNEVLQTINAVSQELSSTLDIQKILERLVEANTKLLNATSGYFSDWNTAAGTTTVLAEYISSHASAEERISDLGQTYRIVEHFGQPLDWPLQIQGYTILHADDENVPQEERQHLQAYGIQSVLTIPMIIDNEPFGLFEVYESRYRREFQPSEVDLFRTLINQAISTIENARLYERTQHSEERNRALVAQSPQAIIQWDENFCVAEWNAAAERIFGYNRAQALGQHAHFNVPESVWPKLDEIWEGLLNQTGGQESINQNITADGRVITCSWQNTPLRNEQGQVIGVLSNVTDITEQVQAETQLRYQAQVMDQVSDAIISADLGFNIRSWNKAAERLYGYTAEETIGRNVSEFIETTYLNYAPGEGTRILLSTGQFNDRAIQRTKNGRELVVDTFPTLLKDEQGQVSGLVAVNRDVTNIQIAEQERQRLVGLLENTSDFVGIADVNGRGVFINRAGRAMLGIPEEIPVRELSTPQIFPPHVFKRLQEEIIPFVMQQQIWEGESSLRHWQDGREIPVSQVILPELDSDGQLLTISTIARDLTAQKAAEAELLARQEMLRRQQQVSLQLTQSDTINKHGLEAALREITEAAAHAFEVARASIWLYDPQAPAIKCLDLYERDKQTHSQGIVLGHDLVPAYFQALTSSRSIVAHDIHTHPATYELSDFYAKPLGINSLMDTFIRAGEEIRGVVCLEHIGPARIWTPEEENFANSLADFAALVMEAEERQRLQQQISQSLVRRSRQVQTTTQIAQEIASAGELYELYQRVVDLTKEEFGYYHAQILQYNPALDAVALMYGYGEVGQKMLQAGHAMPLGVGLIGRAAQSGQPVLSVDVRQNPNWRPQPLLPDTVSELAVPIKFGHQVLGVLDVQSNVRGQITAEDQLVLEGLCGQIGTAIESTRLRQDMEERLNELNNLQRLISREAWQSYLSTFEGQPTGYLFDKQTVQPLMTNGEGKRRDTGRLVLPITAEKSRTLPISVRGEVIGTIGVQDIGETPLSLEEEELLSAISAQVAEALENARLLEQTQKRAVEMETVAQVSAATSSILEVQEMLQAVVDLSKASFGLYHAHIYLYNKEQRELTLVAGAGEIGLIMTAEGWHIPLYQQQSLVARAARGRRGLIVADTRKDPDFLPNPLLPQTRSEMIVPMVVGDELVGVLDLQASRPNYFTEDDLRIQTTLSTQIAIAVQNARLFQEQIETAAKLREVDRLKSQFLASMSHELRTPLNSIIGFADVLLEGIDGELNERMEEDVLLIREGGQHLRALIGDILDMAKIEAGRMDLSYSLVDLERVAHEVMAATSGLVKDKPIELKLTKDEGMFVEVDRTRLVQILLNLLSNAAKFTDRGVIELGMKHDDAEHVLISVRDSGVGIKPEDASQVFEQFRQIGDMENRKAGGTGLGMPITKQLVELHGGRIWLESVHGEGTTFFVRLPIHKPEGIVQTHDGYYG